MGSSRWPNRLPARGAVGAIADRPGQPGLLSGDDADQSLQACSRGGVSRCRCRQPRRWRWRRRLGSQARRRPRAAAAWSFDARLRAEPGCLARLTGVPAPSPASSTAQGSAARQAWWLPTSRAEVGRIGR